MTRLWRSNAGPVAVVVAVLAMFFSGLALSPVRAAAPYAEKSIGNFKVFAVLTVDKDFWEKWDTPVWTVPEFNFLRTLKPGQQTRLIILVANPRVVAGKIDLVCDVDVTTKPKLPFRDIAAAPCAPQLISPQKNRFYMMEYSAVLSASKGEDLPVDIKLNLRVTDKNAGRTVRLRLGVKVAEK